MSRCSWAGEVPAEPGVAAALGGLWVGVRCQGCPAGKSLSHFELNKGLVVGGWAPVLVLGRESR